MDDKNMEETNRNKDEDWGSDTEKIPGAIPLSMLEDMLPGDTGDTGDTRPKRDWEPDEPYRRRHWVPVDSSNKWDQAAFRKSLEQYESFDVKQTEQGTETSVVIKGQEDNVNTKDSNSNSMEEDSGNDTRNDTPKFTGYEFGSEHGHRITFVGRIPIWVKIDNGSDVAVDVETTAAATGVRDLSLEEEN